MPTSVYTYFFPSCSSPALARSSGVMHPNTTIYNDDSDCNRVTKFKKSRLSLMITTNRTAKYSGS